MVREDVASQSFAILAAAECERRSAEMRRRPLGADPSMKASVYSILARRVDEQHRVNREKSLQKQAEEEVRRAEKERAEFEYRNWRREVRNARFQQESIEQVEDTIVERDLERL